MMAYGAYTSEYSGDLKFVSIEVFVSCLRVGDSVHHESVQLVAGGGVPARQTAAKLHSTEQGVHAAAHHVSGNT